MFRQDHLWHVSQMRPPVPMVSVYPELLSVMGTDTALTDLMSLLAVSCRKYLIQLCVDLIIHLRTE